MIIPGGWIGIHYKMEDTTRLQGVVLACYGVRDS